MKVGLIFSHTCSPSCHVIHPSAPAPSSLLLFLLVPLQEFKAQVEALAIQLYAILRDTAQMGQFAHDPETAIDLHLRIADNYKSSPDLR